MSKDDFVTTNEWNSHYSTRDVSICISHLFQYVMTFLRGKRNNKCSMFTQVCESRVLICAISINAWRRRRWKVTGEWQAHGQGMKWQWKKEWRKQIELRIRSPTEDSINGRHSQHPRVTIQQMEWGKPSAEGVCLTVLHRLVTTNSCCSSKKSPSRNNWSTTVA